MTAPLDRRILREGRPAGSLRLMGLGRWLVLERADGPEGVVLKVRIPGWLTEDQPYPDQEAAREAAAKIAGEYRQSFGNPAR
jgi:hypothetical protein